MDLGTYERMLDQDLTRDNFATSGQIFRTVLDKERAGSYLGRDVQMIPHVTGEVKSRLRELAVKSRGRRGLRRGRRHGGRHRERLLHRGPSRTAYEEGEGSVLSSP
jgi:CTP synthase